MNTGIQDASRARVLYQRSGARGAFEHIDEGLLNGYRSLGCEVSDWTDADSRPSLGEMLAEFNPTHFVGCLHSPDRTLSRWTRDGSIAALRDSPAHRSVRMIPPDIEAFFRDQAIDFSSFPEFGVSSFYNRPAGCTPEEFGALRSGAIDLVRSPLASEAIGVCFRSVLELGVPVLEEPHAADVKRFGFIEPAAEPRYAASFVGRCWPFKWSHMGPYVEAMLDAFGDRFAVFGSGWPEGVSRGTIDDAGFASIVADSAVCLSLHEPTQVLAAPFAQNERVFKLLSMGACVVSDANPLLAQQFEIGEELVIAGSPSAMVEAVGRLDQDRPAARSIARAGRTRVLAEHTYAHRAQRLLAVAADPKGGSGGQGVVVTRTGETLGAVNV